MDDIQPDINNMKLIFREEATSTLVGFHAGHLSGWNWNSEMLVFQEEGKPEKLEKPSEQGENQRQIQPTYDARLESNHDCIGGRRALSPLRQRCWLPYTKPEWLKK